MNHLRVRRAQLLTSLTLAAATSAIAQHPAVAQPSASNTPTLKLTTRLTQVDVTATDLNGHPVQGLKQSDFTVKEDGKPQPIKNFEESGAQNLPPQPATHLPPNTYTNAHPQLPNTSAVNVLLIDDITTGYAPDAALANVARSRNEATKYIQTMPPGTAIILVEMADRLRVIQPLTTDRAVLLAALHSIGYKQSIRTGCDGINARSEIVVNSLDSIATYLSGIKGRKNIIWFSPGFPQLTAYTGFESCLRDYTASLQRDYNLLAAAQVALYPVDPEGVVVNGGRPLNLSGHFSMEEFADATGGRAFYDSNDIAAEIGAAIVIGTDSYSLSYVPPVARYDGQHHKINVTVDRPGIQLTYRKGYTSMDPAKTPKPATTPAQESSTPPPPDASLYAAMAHGAAPSTQIVFTVGITPSTPPIQLTDPIIGQIDTNLKLKGKSLTRYDFNFKLSPEQVTLTDVPGQQHQAAIEFTVAAYNGQGEMLNVIRQTASLTLTPTQLATFLKRDIPIHLQLDLPPGPLFLRTAIRDIPSNKLGTLEIPLTVPK